MRVIVETAASTSCPMSFTQSPSHRATGRSAICWTSAASCGRERRNVSACRLAVEFGSTYSRLPANGFPCNNASSSQRLCLIIRRYTTGGAKAPGRLADVMDHRRDARRENASGADVVVRLHPENPEIASAPEQAGEDDQPHGLGEHHADGHRHGARKPEEDLEDHEREQKQRHAAEENRDRADSLHGLDVLFADRDAAELPLPLDRSAVLRDWRC